MADDYGFDVSTFPDLNVTGVAIKSKRAVAERVLRRWVTPSGSLDYDPDAGYDLRDLLNDDLTTADLRRHASLAGMEAEKDEAVQTMTVTMTFEPDSLTLKVRARGVLVDGQDMTFTASITQISADFLSLA